MQRNTKAKDGSIRKRLGRGLESLISKPVAIDAGSQTKPDQEERDESPTVAPPRPVEPKPAISTAKPAQRREETAGGIVSLAVGSIVPNRRQPRQSIDDAALESLAQSIRQAGLMQPIVVRPAVKGEQGFELVAGERRWRAAQRIGLANIPAIVRELDDRAAAELALVENIQREDLNPIDRAEAFERLLHEFDITHQQLAERVGLDRSTITNFTRLTMLDEFSREMVRAGKLSMGHAKVLLAITNDKVRSDLAGRVVRQGLSVRALEREVELLRQAENSEPAKSASAKPRAAHLVDLERRLAEHLGTKVRIRAGAKKGTGSIAIDFYTIDQFEGLMQRLDFATSDLAGA